MNLSPNFTLAELTHTDHRDLENIPNEAEVKNLYRLAQFLEQVRDLLARPILVSSAFRSKAVNDSVNSKDMDLPYTRQILELHAEALAN